MIIGRARPFYFSAAVPWRVAENDPPPYCSTAGLVYLSILVLADWYSNVPYRNRIMVTEYQVPESNGLGEKVLGTIRKKGNTVKKMRRRAPWVPAKPPQRKAGLGMVQ